MSTAEAFTADLDAIAFTPEGEPFEVATGEILAPDDPRVAAYLESIDAAAPPIACRADVEQALERLADIEGRKAGLEARREMYVRNMNAQIGREQRRLDWWTFKYKAGVTEFAKRELTGKGKTAHFDHGRVKFRTAPGTTTILDMDAAVAYVSDWHPADVKVVRTVGVKAIARTVETAIRVTGEPQGKLPFIDIEGPRESITIDTGIGPKDKS